MTPARRPARSALFTRQGRGSAAVAGVSALLLVGGGMGVVLSSAEAATPTDGTVSPGSAPATWGGGPFLTPNQTGAAGDPDCTAPQSCDDFKLNVANSAGYDVKVDVKWPNAAADFDVYLLDPAGKVVATAASSDDPEMLSVPAPAGVYTVRVVPYAPLGESYTASATLVAAAAPGATGNPGPPSTETAPGYQAYAAPDSIPFTKANDAGEPSIGNNHKTGATMYQAGLSTFKTTFDDSTSPATATWTDVSANATNGCPQGSTASFDPILFTDSATGRTFESQLTLQDSLTCYTDDDGKTWNPSQGGGFYSGKDHQTIGGGPFAPGGVGPTGAYPNAVYYCSQDIADALCAVSHDGGTTFPLVTPTYTIAQCGGLHGHIRVAPDGTAYLPNKSCTDPADGLRKAAVAVSTDDGVTWTVKIIDGSTAGASDPSVSIGKNGTVYAAYLGKDGLPAVATSTDRGDTWTNQQTVGTEFGIQNAVFPTVIAGDDDRAAFAYLGTPTAGDRNVIGFAGIWHLYIDTTYDGGKTWVTSDATPKDPVQRGVICTNGTTCPSGTRNLLDFIDITMDSQGRALVGFADGCIGACVTDPNVNNRDAYSTIARQNSGKTLLAAFDPTGTPTGSPTGTPTGSPTGSPTSSPTSTPTSTVRRNVKLTGMRVVKRNGHFITKLTFRNNGNVSLRNVRSQVKDNGKYVGMGAPMDLAVNQTKQRSIHWRYKAKQHTHRIVAKADPNNRIAEANETDNQMIRIVKLR